MNALGRHGITHAFPIQAATITDALAGRDVLGKARTGSGKTLGFGLPAIVRLSSGAPARPRRPRAVVLVPTRELAMQVADSLEPYAHALHVSIRLVAGGLSMAKQVAALERGVDLLVATPGRLVDLISRGHASMRAAEMVVLDEADHMADLGFMDELTEILAEVPASAQRLLFSATLDGAVDRLVAGSMNHPVLHDVAGPDADVPQMRHLALSIPPQAKYALATRIAARPGRTLVFVRTKLATERIAQDMREAGVLAMALHGDRSQAERNQAIAAFRAGEVPVLVATDVAARGIHVDHVDLVLQVDPPVDPKDYTHRAGRTARAGAEGLVVTLVLPHQRKPTDRMFEGTGVDVTFRKVKDIDPESIAKVDALTGAREPSGVPVRPLAPPRAERAETGPRSRGQGRGGPRGGGQGRSARSERRDGEVFWDTSFDNDEYVARDASPRRASGSDRGRPQSGAARGEQGRGGHARAGQGRGGRSGGGQPRDGNSPRGGTHGGRSGGAQRRGKRPR